MVRKHQTSDAQLRIGESRDSGFDALHRPGMTRLGALPHAALVADCAEVFVDAEYDQDEFRENAREHDPDHHAGDAGEQHQKSTKWADRHGGEAGEDAR